MPPPQKVENGKTPKTPIFEISGPPPPPHYHINTYFSCNPVFSVDFEGGKMTITDPQKSLGAPYC